MCAPAHRPGEHALKQPRPASSLAQPGWGPLLAFDLNRIMSAHVALPA